MNGGLKGMVMGFVNTCLVGVCAAVLERNVEMFFVLSMFGSLFGVGIGWLLGRAAEDAQQRNRLAFLAGMFCIAWACVSVLSLVMFVDHLVFVAMIPTAITCWMLERWTRAQPDELPPKLA